MDLNAGRADQVEVGGGGYLYPSTKTSRCRLGGRIFWLKSAPEYPAYRNIPALFEISGPNIRSMSEARGAQACSMEEGADYPALAALLPLSLSSLRLVVLESSGFLPRSRTRRSEPSMIKGWGTK